MTRLAELASVVRSKNTSPFTWSLDIIFLQARDYERFKERGLIDEALVTHLYGLPAQQVLDIVYFDPASAIKICLRRDIPSGSAGDTDVYGAQQHAPLLSWEFDWP
jgi:uncharacterized protein DUF4387